MQLESKVQIARGTLTVLAVVKGLFLMGLVVLVLCAGLDINPFRETTTSFLISAFVGLIVAAVLVLLSVATNMSLIADAKIAELKVEPRPAQLKKWALGFFAVAVMLAGFIFVGTYLSKNRYLAVVREQAEDVLKTNENLLNEIGHLLGSGKYEDHKRVDEIRAFLQNQRSGLPQLTIVYSDNFEGKPALYKVATIFATAGPIRNIVRSTSRVRRVWTASTSQNSFPARMSAFCRNTPCARINSISISPL